MAITQPTIPPEYATYFAQRRWNVPVLELVAVEWVFSGFTKVYAYTNFLERLAERRGTAFESEALEGLEIELRLQGGPIREIPRSADISDDQIELNFWDGPINGDPSTDNAISKLYAANGAGVRVEVYRYYPDIDWLQSRFWGLMKRPDEMLGTDFRVKVASGFRSGELTVPKGAFYTSCANIFGGQLATLEQCVENWRCPYDRHLGGSNGLLVQINGVTETVCKKTQEACVGFWGDVDDLPFGGFQTIVESAVVTQTKGPNLLATTRGHENEKKNPPQVIAGHVRAELEVLASTPEPNTNHPEKGSIRGLFHISRGPIQRATIDSINGVTPQSNTAGTSQIRTGTFRQAPTTYSNNVQNYSGEAVGYIVQNPVDTRGNVPAPTASADIYGFARVRTYAADGSLTYGYSINRGDWLRTIYEDKDWGLGYSANRFDNEFWAALSAWCAETVGYYETTIPAVTDDEGNVLEPERVEQVPLLRSTFNQVLTGRNARDQVYDLCQAGFISPPFVRNGKLCVVPIAGVTLNSDVPVFTNRGGNRNIIRDTLRAKELETPTRIKLTYDDEAFNWQEIPLLFSSDAAELREGFALGDFTRNTKETSFPGFGITNFAEAERVGNMLFGVGAFAHGGDENPLEVTFETWSLLAESMGLYPNQVIKIEADELAGEDVPFVERTSRRPIEYFRIKKLTDLQNLHVRVVTQAHPVDWWARIEDATQALPMPAEPGTENSQVIDNDPIVELI